MTSVMAIEGNTCKRMRNSSTIAEFLQCNDGKLEEAEYFKCVFRRLVCVRIEKR